MAKFVRITLEVVAKVNDEDLAQVSDQESDSEVLESLLSCDDQTLTVKEVPGYIDGIAEADWTHLTAPPVNTQRKGPKAK